ncbi:hypothetical protein OKA05_10580 [Luteolibacter arcticus]|uniref:Uncharacterized protein n=1 Tax=Luteolibacter arcticus TaxID=1581411 RepID=A0ABT3GHP5_9BACT|nr:hypothetical protein [Luteolibacter arcticus]MCW1922998.1 hypothetical protein [Luteolibacter arcticus]
MKRRSAVVRPGGILRWSTLALLTGAGLTGCDSGYVATAKDQQMAETQKRIDELDAQKAKLAAGMVLNNFHLEGVGYYHADARDFFPHPYGFEQSGKWFVNGIWQNRPGLGMVADSRPTPEALKKVEAALEKEQKQLAGQSGTAHGGGSGFGMGNALLMYWMLSGNRGFFSPGNGFRQASSQAPGWQGGVESQRSAVASHAAANPGYQRMVQQSRASGVPVRAGQSVRGGFGSSRSGGGGGSGFSSGS